MKAKTILIVEPDSLSSTSEPAGIFQICWDVQTQHPSACQAFSGLFDLALGTEDQEKFCTTVHDLKKKKSHKYSQGLWILVWIRSLETDVSGYVHIWQSSDDTT